VHRLSTFSETSLLKAGYLLTGTPCACSIQMMMMMLVIRTTFVAKMMTAVMMVMMMMMAPI